MEKANIIRLAGVLLFVMFAVAMVSLISCKLDAKPHNEWYLEVWEESSPLATASDTSQQRCVDRMLVNIFDSYDGINETAYVPCALGANQFCRINNTSADTIWFGAVATDEYGNNKEEVFFDLILPGKSKICGIGDFSLYPSPDPMVWELTPPWILKVFRSK